MNTINLEDAKVSYLGETLPALELISRLQTQLREAASGIAAAAQTLGELRTALLNSHTVDVKLTLSKEDYEKFRSLNGTDDIERIRKAVMTLIHPEEVRSTPGAGEPKPAPPVSEPAPAPAAVEERAAAAPAPAPPPEPERPAGEQAVQEQPVTPEQPKKKLITKCPTCQSLIDVPDARDDQWPIELKCGNCGSKCLLKPSFRKPLPRPLPGPASPCLGIPEGQRTSADPQGKGTPLIS